MAQTLRTRWQLPLEHGAWGMLYIPMVLGFLRAGIWTWQIPELFLAATGCFLVRRPLLAWARAIHWNKPAGDAPRLVLIYLAVGGLSGAVLIVPAGLWGLAALAAIAAIILGVNTWQGVIREDRTFTGELTAIAGMTLTGPAALYAATARLDFGALLLWAECLLYFLSAVVYVKLRVSAVHERHRRATTRLRLACVGYHVFALVSLALLVSQNLMTPVGALGYMPVVVRAFWFAARPHRRLNLQRIGWSEVAFSAVFLAANSR